MDILCDPTLQCLYLIVDALDECQTGRSELLDLIAFGSAASPVKWIISSRNWPEIEKKLGKAGQKVPLSLELNAKSVSVAVQLYVREKVRCLADDNDYDTETTEQVTSYLSSNARDTFLWVALVCRSLEDVHRFNTLETLHGFPAGLDDLYARMMQRIRGMQHANNVNVCMQMLSIASTVFRPLTLEELASLIDCPFGTQHDNNWLEFYVGLCGSFLAIREHAIFFVHQSAKDFLCNPSLNSEFNKVFPSATGGMHHTLFSKSLQLLSGTLHRDMYRLSHPGVPVEDAIPPDRDPLAAARYSCVYWVDHLSEAHTSNMLVSADLQDGGTVHGFLHKKYLYWLEALSLVRDMPKGVLAVGKLQSLIQNGAEESQLEYLVRDMRRFILSHRFVIETAPLQAYVSALFFSPTQSLTRRLFQCEEPKWLIKQPIVGEDWSACITTFEGHSSSVNSVAFSADGRQLASGSDDRTVKLWDAATGACVATFEGHSGAVNSVAFSADGCQLASGSDDRTVKLWDAATGACLQTIHVGRTIYRLSFNVTGACLDTDIGSIDLPVSSPSPSKNISHEFRNTGGYRFGINNNRTWITYGAKNLLWLPPEYRPASSGVWVVKGSTIAIGCSSGRVWFLRFSMDTIPNI